MSKSLFGSIVTKALDVIGKYPLKRWIANSNEQISLLYIVAMTSQTSVISYLGSMHETQVYILVCSFVL